MDSLPSREDVILEGKRARKLHVKESHETCHSYKKMAENKAKGKSLQLSLL